MPKSDLVRKSSVKKSVIQSTPRRDEVQFRMRTPEMSMTHYAGNKEW